MARNRQFVVILGVFAVAAVAATAARSGQQLRYGSRTDQTQLKEIAYPVTDLTMVSSCYDVLECFRRLPECSGWFAAIEHLPPTPSAMTMDEFLIRLITTTIDPASWNNAGGNGSIAFAPNPYPHKLIVKQTPANHDKVAELLAAMMRVQAVEVAIEIRLVNMSTRHGEMFSNIADAHVDAGNTAFSIDRQLDDRQLKGWFKVFQDDRQTHIMQAPKLTIFNGQRADINVGDELVMPTGERVEFGVFCKTLPVVSIDRKTVQLDLDMVFRNLVDAEAIDGKKQSSANPRTVTPARGANYKLERGVETLSASRNVSIPAGKIIAMPICKGLSVPRSEFGPPILSKIPYLNRLFTNVGYGREELEFYAFVTARVIINDAAVSDASQKR